MNLASILPCATVRAGAGGATPTAAPAGFLDVLAAQATVPGQALPLDAGDLAGDGGEDAAAQDLLALAALASRTAHAALPQVLPTESATTEVPAETSADTPADELAVDPTTEPVADDATAEAHVAVVVGGEAAAAAATSAAAPSTGDDVEAASAVAVDAAGATDAGASDATQDADVEAAAATDDAQPAPVDRRASGGAATADVTDAADAGDELQGQRLASAPATPSERRRDRTEATPARTGIDGARAVDGDVATAPTASGDAAPATGRADALAPSSAAQRVLDIVSQLEDAPPPRVVVIETGEIRLRIGLDAGTVRLTVLGQLGEGGEELLRETADALEAGGFGTELDRGTGDGADRGRRHDAHDRDLPGAAVGPLPARPASRSRGGIQL